MLVSCEVRSMEGKGTNTCSDIEAITQSNEIISLSGTHSTAHFNTTPDAQRLPNLI